MNRLIPLIVVGLLLFFTAPRDAFSQNDIQAFPAQFLVTSYSPNEYGAGTQNWDMVQDSLGRVYIANRDGVLVFDGINWGLVELPISTPLRSLAIDSRGRVYVGGVGQFGFLEPDSLGALQFISLSEQFDDVISDVWETHIINEGVLFVTRTSLYLCESYDCRVITPGFAMSRSFLINGSVLVSVPGQGIAQLRGDRLEVVIEEAAYNRGHVFKVIESQGFDFPGGRVGAGLYIIKRSGEVSYFEYATSAMHAMSELLGREVRIPPETYRVITLRNGNMAFATISNGIHIVNHHFDTQYYINRNSGLRVDMALNVFEDRSGSLWALLNNGISRIDQPDYVRYWNEDSGVAGTVLNLSTWRDELVISTSAGVYLAEFGHGYLRPLRLNPVASQFWQTLPVRIGNREILMLAGNNQLSYWDGNRYQVISETTSRTLYQSRKVPGRVYVGYVQGWGYVDLETDASGAIRVVRDVQFNDPPFEIRQIFEDDEGNVWLHARFHGVYKANMNGEDPEIEIFTYDWGDVSRETIIMGMHVVGDSLIFSGPEGFLTLDSDTRHFSSGNRFMDDRLSDRVVMAVQDAGAGRLLVLMHQGYAILENDATGTWRVALETGRDVPDAPMYGLAQVGGYIWTGGAEGLFRYTIGGTPNYHTPFQAIISSVLLNQDSLVFGGHLPSSHVLELDYDRSQVSIYFGSLRSARFRNLQFESKLEGFDRDWSSPTTESRRIYTNLPDGTYRFRVRATDHYGIISDEGVLLIRVATPWFKAWWAYLLYSLAGAGLLFGVVRLRTASVLRKNRELERIIAERTASLQIEKRRLEIINQELRIQDEHRDKFLSVVAHDLRNPLMIIRSSAELAEDEANLPEERMELTGFIKDAADRMQKIIEILLEDRAKKIRSTVGEGTRVHVASLIEQIVKEYAQWLERKSISVDTSGVDKDLYMNSDAAVAGVIVSNLLSNAIKYSESRKRVWIKASTDEVFTRISIADEGLGMTASDIREVGKPFKKLSARPTDGEASSGLGLHIVKDLIEDLGGSLEVQSPGPGLGATFTVAFPVKAGK